MDEEEERNPGRSVGGVGCGGRPPPTPSPIQCHPWGSGTAPWSASPPWICPPWYLMYTPVTEIQSKNSLFIGVDRRQSRVIAEICCKDKPSPVYFGAGALSRTRVGSKSGREFKTERARLETCRLRVRMLLVFGPDGHSFYDHDRWSNIFHDGSLVYIGGKALGINRRRRLRGRDGRPILDRWINDEARISWRSRTERLSQVYAYKNNRRRTRKPSSRNSKFWLQIFLELNWTFWDPTR